MRGPTISFVNMIVLPMFDVDNWSQINGVLFLGYLVTLESAEIPARTAFYQEKRMSGVLRDR